jgi:hypothetical protein
MNTVNNQGMIGNKSSHRQHVDLMHRGDACGKIMGHIESFPLWKKYLSVLYLNCRGVKEKRKLGVHECWHPGY